jgi:putative two-component system response regulator
VGRLARLLAVRIGKDEAFCRDIEKAAAWHDLGKLSIPNHIILKRARLKPEQIMAMQEHTKHGAQLLSEQPVEHSAIRMAVGVARSHHERWDSHGYPDSLKGEEIPEAARMTSLAEVFDALTHKRPWRGPMSASDAIELIAANRGTQFDPHLADQFVGLVRELVRAHGTDLDAFLVQGSHSSALVELRKDILRRSSQ